MKVIDFKTRKVIHEDNNTPPPPKNRTTTSNAVNAVPIQTYSKGKFTLALLTSNGLRELIIYNTSSKAEIARHKVMSDNVSDWLNWANKALEKFNPPE